jgi:hypothetical protein
VISLDLKSTEGSGISPDMPDGYADDYRSGLNEHAPSKEAEHLTSIRKATNMWA